MTKRIVKAIIKGLATFDANKDGKVTWQEIKNASFDTWVTFLTGVLTSILSALKILGL